MWVVPFDRLRMSGAALVEFYEGGVDLNLLQGFDVDFLDRSRLWSADALLHFHGLNHAYLIAGGDFGARLYSDGEDLCRTWAI